MKTLWKRTPSPDPEAVVGETVDAPPEDRIAEPVWVEMEPDAESEPVTAEESPDAEAAEAEQADTVPARRRWYRSAAIPWSLFLMAVAAAAIFAVMWQRSVAAERQRTEIVTTADHFLSALTNFKAPTIEADVARIRGFAVGDFASQVDQFFGPSTVASIKRAGVVSTGTVRSVFVQAVNGSAATVLGVVNESVVNESSSTPRTEVLRVVVELIQTRSGWRIDKVDVLQTPDQTSPFGS